MKIGIFGAGNIGGTIGELRQKAGHEVLFSSRGKSADSNNNLSGAGKRFGTNGEVARFGEMLLLAVPFWEIDNVMNEVV